MIVEDEGIWLYLRIAMSFVMCSCLIRMVCRFMLVDFGLAHQVDHSHNVGCSKVKRKRTIDEIDAVNLV